ncbi:MAG: VWA domain-containing protein [Pyrinomonadaceae bacterium]
MKHLFALCATSWLIVIGICYPSLGYRLRLPWQEEVIKVNSDLIVLNLTATDARGEFARGLGISNFEVMEDGRPQKITTFGVAETPFAAAILLDASGSMERRVSLARSAAIRFLDALRADDVAAVYGFSSEIERMQDFSSSRDLEPVAYDLRAKGMTVLNDAIVRAARDLAERPEKRRAIVVLSDGADTRSKASTEQALLSALAADATIYTVDMSGPEMGSALVNPDSNQSPFSKVWPIKQAGATFHRRAVKLCETPSQASRLS